MTDELLRALGRVQRAQQAEQARAEPESWQQPLDADEQAKILAAVLGEAVPEQAPAADNVVPLARAPARRRWLAPVMTLAAAAALLLFVRFGGEAEVAGPPLPGYSLRASGEMSVRGSEPDEAPIVLRPATAIDWTLTPAAAIRETIGVRVIASQDAQQRWIAAEGAAQISSDGVVRLRGRAGAWLDLSPGTWTLTIVIGRAEALPADLAAFNAGVARAHERGWQLQQVQVQVEG